VTPGVVACTGDEYVSNWLSALSSATSDDETEPGHDD